MKGRRLPILQWISILLIFLAIVLAALQLVRYSRVRASFPPGTVVAGIHIGNLDRQQAAERIMQAYSLPVEVRYGDAVIQLRPANLGFELDLETMLAAAERQRINQPFWSAFWGYLWNQLPAPREVPLRATISEDRLRTYLAEEVAARYDRLPEAPAPVPGGTTFAAGVTGTRLDIDRAVTLIQDALRSPTSRVVNLSYNSVAPPRPSFDNLAVQLRQVIDASRFDGIAEIYLLDLQSQREIHFARQNQEELSPDIAFTAASTVKLPIMVSTFRRVGEPLPDGLGDLILNMIEISENEPADELMAQVMDSNLGPLDVTADMNELGLNSTFLAGYFYPGAPLLKRFATPANSRTDVNTGPDEYNQTTPSEMGTLLNDLYQCSEDGGGALAAAFPGEISQTECRTMIEYLTRNMLPALIPAGLPEGTRIAHKHGWITESDGYIHTFSDAALIYSPGGDYILVIFLHHPVQLLWDTANMLMAELSMAAYNYYNTGAP